jgi:hypothetical protein
MKPGPTNGGPSFYVPPARIVLDARSMAKNAVDALRMAVPSGHGIGKSTLVAWIVNWIMSTRPYAQGC